MALQHLRSSTANKRPLPAGMSDGQLAINTESTSPGLFFKNSGGSLVKVGPVHVGTTAPNATPASGGQSGNSTGELWLDTSLTPNELKTWDGSAWVSATGQEIPVSKLIDGSARQLLQTDAAGTGVEWTSNVDVPGTLDVTGAAVFDSSVAVTGTLTKSGNNVVTVGDTGTVTSTMILDGTIVNGDVNASAAIAGTKISPDFGSQTVTTTGVFSSALGAAATPSITFTGDLNTGIYSPGADQVAISTGGTGRLFVDASGNVSVGAALDQVFNLSKDAVNVYARFTNNTINAYVGISNGSSAFDNYVASAHPWRVLTNGTEKLRITSDGKLGLGTSSPAQQLHVLGSGAAIRVDNSDAGANVYGDILSVTGGTFSIRSRGGASTHGSVSLNTWDGTNDLTRLFVSSTGNVGIGVTSPDTTLHVHNATAGTVTASTNAHLVVENSANTGINILTPSNQSGQILFGDPDDNDIGRIQYNHASDYLAFYTAANERLRIDSSGRLLIGTSSSRVGYGGNVSCQLQIEGTNRNGLGIAVNESTIANRPAIISLGRSRGSAVGSTTIVNSGDRLGAISFEGADGSQLKFAAEIYAEVDGTPGANDMPGRLVFSTTADGASSPTERMRITSNPLSSVLIGQTSNPATSTVVVAVQTGSANGVNAQITSNTGTSYPWANYNASGTYVGGISCTSTATSFPTSSDYRLKQNVHPLVNASALVAQLKPSTFEFKEDTGTQVQGFIAHELQEVVPLAVIGEKDAEDANGNPIYQGVDAAKLVPLLTAALQEALAEIESLKARVTALEP